MHGVDPAPLKQAYERALHVAGRDHIVSFHFHPILKPHTESPPVPLQHLGYPCAVPDCSPKAGEARLDGFGESERAADGITRGFLAHRSERHDEGEERPGSAIVCVPDAVTEQWILEACSEGLQCQRKDV